MNIGLQNMDNMTSNKKIYNQPEMKVYHVEISNVMYGASGPDDVPLEEEDGVDGHSKKGIIFVDEVNF